MIRIIVQCFKETAAFMGVMLLLCCVIPAGLGLPGWAYMPFFALTIGYLDWRLNPEKFTGRRAAFVFLAVCTVISAQKLARTYYPAGKDIQTIIFLATTFVLSARASKHSRGGTAPPETPQA